ncbi:MAG: NAD(+)/NADH kinase [Clostridiaceae bacterium]|nr:NAD(+)/NADH kinase [Clostridiaceae bacterium]
MKRIAIFPNKSRDPDFSVTNLVVSEIVKHGGQAVIEPELAEGFRSKDIEFNSYNDCDLLICLGGDGTFLSAAHHPSSQGLPQIGVNLGSVGFLTEVEPDQIPNMISKLLNDDFEIEERMMLEMRCFDDNNQEYDNGFALNDIVISRGWGNTGIVTIDLTVDGSFVEQIPGDGIIVSTSTGSTAYNLAAGGPIVHPLVDVILMTPVAPHTLHNRTYITACESDVKLELETDSGAALISLDGRQIIDIKPEYYAIINGSDRTFKKINLFGDNFYQTLPSKIRLRGINK